jgi:DNA-directed RNA polymerase subunit omega
MIYPAMSSLLKKVDSRYTLVIAAAKRARMLTNGAKKLTSYQSTKDVTIAIHEIDEEKVTYHKISKVAPSKENLVETTLSTNEE